MACRNTMRDQIFSAIESAPPHVYASTLVQTFAGVTAILLIFFASAGLTLAYFKDTSGSRTQNLAAAAQPDPFNYISLLAESVYVLDLKTGRVLFSKNADAQLPLASLTKVALVLAVADALPASSILIPLHDTPDGAPIRLPFGSEFRTQDIVDFTLVASSNEGAEILSNMSSVRILERYPNANRDTPVLWRMNDIASNLGLANTYFLNVSGLDLSTTQAGAYGSARDVAHLFGYAASTSSHLFEQTTIESLVIIAVTGQTVTATNTDAPLLAIPGLILGKTGFTDLAGGNLAIVFDVGPAHPVVAVVLKSTQDGRFEDMKKLIATTRAAIAAGH